MKPGTIFIQKLSRMIKAAVQCLSFSQVLEVHEQYGVIHRKRPVLSITTIYKYNLI